MNVGCRAARSQLSCVRCCSLQTRRRKQLNMSAIKTVLGVFSLALATLGITLMFYSTWDRIFASKHGACPCDGLSRSCFLSKSHIFNTRYRHKEVDVFDWRNISNVTESVPIEDITYVDLHPQPTHDPDMMPTILKVGPGVASILWCYICCTLQTHYLLAMDSSCQLVQLRKFID